MGVFNRSSFNDCRSRYRDFRDERGFLTPFFWKLLALRLFFVILFEVTGNLTIDQRKYSFAFSAYCFRSLSFNRCNY